MAMFGIGTLPAMLTLSGGAATLLRPATRRLGGAALVVLGLASGVALLWPAGPGHEHLHHGQHGSLQGPAFLLGKLAGEFPQLRGIEDPDRLAFHRDHAQFREA
jgi:hypothetical protein